MKREFERQKVEEAMSFQHQSWLEDQKRAIIAARLGQPYNPLQMPNFG